MQEGNSHESCVYEGHRGLGRSFAFYDDSGITVDGHTEFPYAKGIGEHYEAYVWRKSTSARSMRSTAQALDDKYLVRRAAEQHAKIEAMDSASGDFENIDTNHDGATSQAELVPGHREKLEKEHVDKQTACEAATHVQSSKERVDKQTAVHSPSNSVMISTTAWRASTSPPGSSPSNSVTTSITAWRASCSPPGSSPSKSVLTTRAAPPAQSSQEQGDKVKSMTTDCGSPGGDVGLNVKVLGYTPHPSEIVIYEKGVSLAWVRGDAAGSADHAPSSVTLMKCTGDVVSGTGDEEAVMDVGGVAMNAQMLFNDMDEECALLTQEFFDVFSSMGEMPCGVVWKAAAGFAEEQGLEYELEELRRIAGDLAKGDTVQFRDMFGLLEYLLEGRP